MGMFKDMLGSDETLFRNSVALDYDFVPKLVPYREKEQRQFAAALKHVLQELEEETDDIIPIYINCWQKNTTHKIVLEFCEAIGYKFTQNRRTDELFDIVKAALNKKSCVLVLDEVDKLEEQDFLYDFLESIYRKSIFAITNFKVWISGLDDRIKSRLMPVTVEFLPYSLEETKGILSQRANVAFYPSVLEDATFNLIADKAHKIQDIRAGIFLLKESGNFAEEEASKKILPKHAEKAIQKLDEFSVKKKSDLDEEGQLVIAILKKNENLKTGDLKIGDSGNVKIGEIRIGDLYKQYQLNGGNAAYRTFQRKLEKLEEGKFIKLTKRVGGLEGTTTIVSLGAR